MKALLLCLFLFGCEDPGPPQELPITDARHLRALRGSGIKDAVSTGLPLFECSDSDSLINSTGFRGKDQSGQVVTGSVCCGWLKGCTVRF